MFREFSIYKMTAKCIFFAGSRVPGLAGRLYKGEETGKCRDQNVGTKRDLALLAISAVSTGQLRSFRRSEVHSN
jgi:hypothetical protein